MEFTHGRGDINRIYTEEEEEDERDERSRGEDGRGVGYTFLPIPSTSPSPSSSMALRWVDGSQPSASSAEPPPPPQQSALVEKEHMFEKVVTPSDVGKLNRLVIPKQHAEKYFPLDASTHDKGLLLNFEDRNGKPWRFRYSYWNSSQSYVMTKGWSRFVKEKRLDAGDTVSFGRGVGDAAARDRLFIDWKRRPDQHLDPPNSLRIPRFPYHQSPSSSTSYAAAAAHHHPYLSFARSTAAPWATSRLFIPQAPPPDASYLYFRSAASTMLPQPFLFPDPAASSVQPVVLDSVPIAHGKTTASSKRVRLFGVNLETPRDADADVDGLFHRPLPSPELRLGISGVEFSSASAASSSSSSSRRGAKDGR